MQKEKETEYIQDRFIKIIEWYAERIGEQIKRVTACYDRIRYIQECEKYNIRWYEFRDQKADTEIIKVCDEMKKAIEAYTAEVEKMTGILGESKTFINEVSARAKEEAEKAQQRIDQAAAAEERKRS